MLSRLAPEDAVHEPLFAVLPVVLAIQVQRLEHGVRQILLLQIPADIKDSGSGLGCKTIADCACLSCSSEASMPI